MAIQQLSCDFKHLSIPVHLGPCRSHLCSRTSTEGAAVITGTGWRRGGGPATWARWSMARASASTLDGFARRKVARMVSITPPPGHYEPGAVGLHRRLPGRRRRAVSDRTAAWRTSRTRTARDAGRRGRPLCRAANAGGDGDRLHRREVPAALTAGPVLR